MSVFKNASDDGRFHRQTSDFRSHLGTDQYPFEEGRYILYVNYGCPWANRTIIYRDLLGLDKFIDISFTSIRLTDDGWVWTGKEEDGSDDKDPIFGFTKIRDLYQKANPDYTKRFTVPVLFDKKTQTIVNNESSEIIRSLNNFHIEGKTDKNRVDLYPEHLRKEIDEINAWLYDKINNGVYKTGFAAKQSTYEENIYPLFEALDKVDKLLEGRDYLLGDSRGVLTEADIRLYPTIARFDIAYYNLFRCNLKRIADYPNITRWYQNLYYNYEACRSATKFDLLKVGYARLAKRESDQEVVVPVGPLNYKP